jgi:uncharacterized membrane protein YdcZ (DUF606 family)
MLTTVTTASTLAASTIAFASLVVILLLIVLLISKELASASLSSHAQRLSQALNVGIVPLTFVFFAIVILRFL